MPHVIERAATGRAKCRGCGQAIAAGELRFGERVPNPFADEGGETTHWFHMKCGALTRPEPFLEVLGGAPVDDDMRSWLERQASLGVAHRRLPRARGVERAATGRAACRSCREPIAKGDWRIALAYYEDGRFSPSGFLHLRCAREYFETAELGDRLRHFSPGLTDPEVSEIDAVLRE